MVSYNLRELDVYYLSTIENTLRMGHMKELCQKHFKNFHCVVGLNAQKVGVSKFVCGALSMVKMLETRLLEDTWKPFLFFEDDVDIFDEKRLDTPLEIPDETDAIFLGLSKAAISPFGHYDGPQPGILRYRHKKYPHLFYIWNMLSMHGIMFHSKKFAIAMLKALMESATLGVIQDTVACRLQFSFRVFALAKPLVYQSHVFGGQEKDTKIDWSEEKDTITEQEFLLSKKDPSSLYSKITSISILSDFYDRHNPSPPSNCLDCNCKCETRKIHWEKEFAKWKLEHDRESSSGVGSTLENTVHLRKALNQVFKQFSIQNVLDCPCGDWNWMQHVDKKDIQYTGIDIVSAIIQDLKEKFENDQCHFEVIDIVTQPLLRSYDLIICRDLLAHLNADDAWRVLKHFVNSGSKYLLATSYFLPIKQNSSSLKNNGWFPLNLCLPPFNFPEPILSLQENEHGKFICLWNIEELLNLVFPLSKKIRLENKKVPRHVYCVWPEEKQTMTTNRLECLETIQHNIGVPIKLITTENMEEYILPNAPFHKSYPFLSFVHKADYLRTYLMHYYGGGYCDIKRFLHSWVHAFDEIDQNAIISVIGYKEIEGGIAKGAPKEAHEHWDKMIGNCAYIVRPQTEFTYAWLNECHKRLDQLYEKLKENPAKVPRDYPGLLIEDVPSQYPVEWSYILGDIFHTLNFKHLDRVRQSLHAPLFTNYQ